MRAKRSRPALHVNGTTNEQRAAAHLQLTVCPDCAAPQVGRLMTHAGTCPIGVGMDRTMDDDAEWFRQHPGADFRTRPVTWAEAAETELSVGWRPTGNVLVRQLVPGLRSRYFTERGER